MNHLQLLGAEFIQSAYTGCTVGEVMRITEDRSIHTIHLVAPEEEHPIVIGIQNSVKNIIHQLQELREGRRNQCYFAKGLTNVDIIRDEETEDLYILESSEDNMYRSYHLKSFEEIEHILTKIQTL